MSKKLVKRADDLRAKYKSLEVVKGSGYHDDDRNPTRPELFLSPQRAGYRAGDPPPAAWPPRMSEHLVGFYDHHDFEQVHFAGPDADKALAALKAFHAKIEAKMKEAERTGQDAYASLTGTERKLRHLIPRLAIETEDGVKVLSLWLSDWNDHLHALQSENIGVTGLPLVE
jgi:hypothetical protein